MKTRELRYTSGENKNIKLEFIELFTDQMK